MNGMLWCFGDDGDVSVDDGGSDKRGCGRNGGASGVMTEAMVVAAVVVEVKSVVMTDVMGMAVMVMKVTAVVIKEAMVVTVMVAEVTTVVTTEIRW